MRVFMSLKDAVVAFPLMATLVALRKPLPRMVNVVPPDEEAVAGKLCRCRAGHQPIE